MCERDGDPGYVGGGYTDVSFDCVADAGRPVYCGCSIEGSRRTPLAVFPKAIFKDS